METGAVAGELHVQREQASFEAFFEQHFASVARALVLIVGNETEAEELTEEAFVRAWDRWERVRTMASPVGYVYRTAVNLNRNRLRRLAGELRRHRPPEPVPDPADTAEDRDRIRTALIALPLGQREALVLVGWFGLGSEEAAAALGIKPASLRARVHRARAELRKTLEAIDE
jgi:RNA polymerase sigma-70 factor (ECF subfamily)